MTEQDDEDLHPKVGHAVRVDYAMWRAWHAAMVEAMADDSGDIDRVPVRMRQILRGWGIEVVELPHWPKESGPPSSPDWPDDGEEEEAA